MQTYDVIVIGAGHNGLTAAAYLARRGQRVLVLERRSVVGGSAVTEEFAPGFRADSVFHRGNLRPEVIHELGLAGLEADPRSAPLAALQPGGGALVLTPGWNATAEAIGRDRRSLERARPGAGPGGGREAPAGGIAAIASSDLLRARATAEIVASELGLEVSHLDPALRERRFGCFEGLTREEVAARFPEAWARYLADPGPAPPGGESRDELVGRLLPAVASAAARLPGPLLVVMHGGAMRALLAEHVGEMPRPSSAAWPLHGIQNGHVYRVTLGDGRISEARLI